MPHVTRHFDIFNFKVGDCSFKMGVPIDQALAPINQALFVHFYKNFDNCIMKIPVFANGCTGCSRHRKGFARPVTRGAKAFKLAYNSASAFCLPLPDFGSKGFTTKLGSTGLFLFCQASLDYHLCRNSSMVSSRLPQRIKATHPVPTHHNIL